MEKNYNIEEENKEFEKVLIGYKKNPNKYKTGIFYLTPGNSKIESIFEGKYSVCGVIVESKCKAEIGLLNNFFREELMKQ